MRVKLKGLHSATKRLADGTKKTYYWAWRGGPRLPGKPGSPEFVAAYNEAVSSRRVNGSGSLQSLLDRYQDSSDFRELADKTQRDYKAHIKAIEREYGDFPLSALTDRRTRGEFLTWRDRIATTSRRTADYRLAVLARALSWAVDRGITAVNPIEKPGRIYRASRNDKVWTADDEARFLKLAPPHLGLALTLALWTGQRQGDLLRLTWAAYDGEWIRLTQQKTGARVAIPVSAQLKAALEAAKKTRKAVTILSTQDGASWTADGFRTSWRKACEKAKIVGLTFHDIRGTAVTRLAMAECTPPEIATITGHGLRDVNDILDAHYLSRDPALAESAIRKLEKRTKLQTKRQTGQSRSAAKSEKT